jgi:hypothetical protein
MSEEGKWNKLDSYPNYIQSLPLQQTATDILGLDYVERNYGIFFNLKKNQFKNKYVVLAPESTAGCKEWTYEGWCYLSEQLIKKGYEVVVLTTKPYYIKDVKCIYGKALNESLNILYHSEFLVINEHACNSCWANINFKFDPGDWDWCPVWKGTDKQHICEKSISPLTVFNSLPI